MTSSTLPSIDEHAFKHKPPQPSQRALSQICCACITYNSLSSERSIGSSYGCLCAEPSRLDEFNTLDQSATLSQCGNESNPQRAQPCVVPSGNVHPSHRDTHSLFDTSVDLVYDRADLTSQSVSSDMVSDQTLSIDNTLRSVIDQHGSLSMTDAEIHQAYQQLYGPGVTSLTEQFKEISELWGAQIRPLKHCKVARKWSEPLFFFATSFDTLAQLWEPALGAWSALKMALKVLSEITDVPGNMHENLKVLVYCASFHNSCWDLLDDHRYPQFGELLTLLQVEYITVVVRITRGAQYSYGIIESAWNVFKTTTPLQGHIQKISDLSQKLDQMAAPMMFREVREGLQELTQGQQQVLAMLKNSVRVKETPETFRSQFNFDIENFIGRETDQNKIREILGRHCQPKKCVALHGKSGIGKSLLVRIAINYCLPFIATDQLAKQATKYIRTFEKDYRYSLFINASTKEQLTGSVHALVIGLKLRGCEGKDVEDQLRILGDWLVNSHQWFMFIDDVGQKTADTVLPFLPQTSSGHIILTTQHYGVAETAAGADCIKLQELNVHDARRLFLQISGVVDSAENRDLVEEIVSTVPSLPYAITQSARYIKVNQLDLSEFWEEYCEDPPEILTWEEEFGLSLWRQFVMSWNRLDEDEQLLLRLFSFFNPSEIPILGSHMPKRKGKQSTASLETPSLYARIRRLVNDRGRFRKALNHLRDYDLISMDHHIIRVHDISHQLSRRKAGEDRMSDWNSACYSILSYTFPRKNESASDQERVNAYLTQAQTVLSLEDASTRGSDMLYAGLCLTVGQCLILRVRYKNAFGYLNVARDVFRAQRGEDHMLTIHTTRCVAYTYRYDGNLEKSVTLFRKIFDLCHSSPSHGPGGRQTIEALNDLATALERSCRSFEAEQLYDDLHRRAVDAYSETHPITLIVAHNRALCWMNLDEHVKADTEHVRILEGSTNEDISGLARTRNNQGVGHDYMGRPREALECYERASEELRERHGPHHIFTLRVLGNVAAVNLALGHISFAEQLTTEVLQSFIELSGLDSFDTAVAQRDKAEILRVRGHLRESHDLLRAVLVRISAASENHPLNSGTLVALCKVELQQGLFSEALTHAKEGWEMLHAMDHGRNTSRTLEALHAYAQVLHSTGELKLAREHYNTCHKYFETVFGLRNYVTLMSLNSLGCLSWTENEQEALTLFQQVDGEITQVYPEGHHNVLAVRINIARTYFGLGQVRKARTLMEAVHEQLAMTCGTNHPSMCTAYVVLGAIEASSGDKESLRRACDWFQKARNGFKHTMPERSVFWTLACCLHIRALHGMGKWTEVTSIEDDLGLRSSATELPGLYIPMYGSMTATELVDMAPEKFRWCAYWPLICGETIVQRRTRKTICRPTGDEPTSLSAEVISGLVAELEES